MKYFAMRLDGGGVTFLEKVEGGWISAPVMSEHRGSLGYDKKNIGQPQYEDFIIQIGWTMSQDLLEWIAASWRPRAPRRNGAILLCDGDLTIQSVRRFSQALIQEVAFPALDGSSKEAGYLRVRFSPESITTEKGSGELALDSPGKQMLWRAAHFRLEIEGLDSNSVISIDPFKLERAPTSRDGRMVYPDLKVSLAGAGTQGWIDWYEDFVITGKDGEYYEKEGTIQFLAPDLKTELARISLHNLGIYRLADEAGQGDQVSRLRAELYCEWMEFHLGRD